MSQYRSVDNKAINSSAGLRKVSNYSLSTVGSILLLIATCDCVLPGNSLQYQYYNLDQEHSICKERSDSGLSALKLHFLIEV